jgi:hypothetical protein
MKRINAYLLGCFFLAACGGDQAGSADAVTGIYVREINNEYAKGNDSLIVSVLDKNAGTYSIQNNYGFMRYLDGKEKGRDYKTQKFTAVYDKEHKQLVDNFKGMVFTVVPEKGLLLQGSEEFRKVK